MRQLLITRDGYKQSYVGANLEAANLKGVNLTAACLEAWNIDSTTILDGVDCQYLFLLEKPDAKGSRERRPHHPDDLFQPGDFEKLYKQMINVVQILLRNGINQEAFAAAFQQPMESNPEISPNAVQGLERKGNMTLTGSTLNLGEISGNVTNSIN